MVVGYKILSYNIESITFQIKIYLYIENPRTITFPWFFDGNDLLSMQDILSLISTLRTSVGQSNWACVPRMKIIRVPSTETLSVFRTSAIYRQWTSPIIRILVPLEITKPAAGLRHQLWLIKKKSGMTIQRRPESFNFGHKSSEREATKTKAPWRIFIIKSRDLLDWVHLWWIH